MGHSNSTSESLYHTALTWRDTLVANADIMHAWLPALEARDGEEAANVDGDVETEEEKSELWMSSNDWFPDSGRCFPLRGIRYDCNWNEKVDIPPNYSCVDRTSEKQLIEAVQVGYDDAKEELKILLLNLVGKDIVDIIQREKIDLQLIGTLEAPAESSMFMDAQMRRVAGLQTLITPMMSHVKSHIKKVEEEHCLVQRLLQHFLNLFINPICHVKVGNRSNHSFYLHTIRDWLGWRTWTKT